MVRAAALQYTPDQNVCFPSHLTATITPNKNERRTFSREKQREILSGADNFIPLYKMKIEQSFFSQAFNSDKDFSLAFNVMFVYVSLYSALPFSLFSTGQWSHKHYAHTHTYIETHYTAHLVQRTGHFSHSGYDSYILCKSRPQPVLTLLKFGLLLSLS